MGNSASTENTLMATHGYPPTTNTSHSTQDTVTEDTPTHKLTSLPFQVSITEPLEASSPPTPLPPTANTDTDTDTDTTPTPPSPSPPPPPPTVATDIVSAAAAAAITDTATAATAIDTATVAAATTAAAAAAAAAAAHPLPKPVPVATGKSGWVSSTGSTSPWVGSLSSSASSNHRDSIHGPYYRARSMSVNRDSEVDEDMTTPQPFKPVESENQGVTTLITWTQGGHHVFVTGTFNGWKHKIKLVKSTTDFNTVLELPSGTHRLKFIVDDEWKCSNDLETATDPDGNLVNYVQVLEEDTESGEGFNEKVMDRSGASTPDEEYTSKVPSDLLALAAAMASHSTHHHHGEEEGGVEELELEEEEREKRSALAAMEWEKKQAQPPTLPPHLEKVLLNSQPVSEEDNSVLLEPNHVTLNHLYACSIKDQVMALSTTTRYRKKASEEEDGNAEN
ncbi:hypothetical protein BDF14DRAFT_1799111 [Spinellus fusiger]|nr:hypothetical protein BDF14DRAFT_1799111 [Spinellus fusiger]